MWRWFRWVLLSLGIIIVLIVIAIVLGFHVRIVAPKIVKHFYNKSGTAFQYNTPTIVDNYIYIGTSNWINYSEQEKTASTFKQNYIYKLDLDLKKVWQYDLPDNQICSGGVTLDSQGNLYFVSTKYSVDPSKQTKNTKNFIQMENYLYSLTNDGKLRWQKRISYDNESWIHGMYNIAISSDDKIYVADSKLFAFDPDGNILWQYPSNSDTVTANFSAPIIDRKGNIYFMSPEPNSERKETDVISLYKFTPDSNGNPSWQSLLGNNIYTEKNGEYGGGKDRWDLSTPAFSYNERRIVAVVGNTVNSVDAESGKLLWSFMPEGITGTFKSSPAIDSNNNIYIGTKDNEDSVLYAIKADGSGVLWKNPIGSDLYSSPLIGDDDTIYLGSESSKTGNVHAVDLKTGKSLWGITNALLEDGSFGSYTLYNGFIYFGTHKQNSAGSLFKIKVKANNYQLNCPWPRYHGSNSNTGRSR